MLAELPTKPRFGGAFLRAALKSAQCSPETKEDPRAGRIARPLPMQLDTLLQQTHALPSIPKVVQELIRSFDDDKVSPEQIARTLATDLVLTGKLLRLANSAHYHAPRSVSTVDDALLMLGFVTVRTLVIGSGLTGGFKQTPGMDLKCFWRYSLHSACVARWLSKPARLNADQAFTIGLMHAIGQLVMHAAMPEQMQELDAQVPALDPRRPRHERRSLGYDHAEVGAGLAAHWKFPVAFSQAIRAVPHPLDQTPFEPMGALIHIAAWRARAAEDEMTQAEMVACFPATVAAKLSFDGRAELAKMPPLAELTAGLEALLG